MARSILIEGRDAGAVATHPAVELETVSVRYGPRIALDEVSMSFPSGSVTALVGPNGAGKSTLLHVIAGVLKHDAGSVRTTLSERPAYVLQRSALDDTLSISVREAVTMGCWARRGALGRITAGDRAVVAEAMERLGIGDLAKRQVGELSGGQRQRVLVAQGLAQQSPLLLLDEPITGLDAVAQQLILDVIAAESAAGTTVVFSTHELSDAARADQVALLVDGHVRAAGTPDEVLRPEVLADAYGQVVAMPDGQHVVVIPPAHPSHC